MTLGGIALGANSPLYSQGFTVVRDGEQGASFKRINIMLNGFLEGEGTDEVMALYKSLRDKANPNNTTFTYIQDSVILHDNRKVYVQTYSEPEDNEFGKVASGDYSIELYYFEDSSHDLGIPVTYGDYTFEKPPKFGRDFFQNKPNPTSNYSNLSKVGVITLQGHLFGETHSILMAKMNALQLAFIDAPGSSGKLFRYGDFAAYCYVHQGSSITPEVIKNFCYFDIKLYYYTNDVIEFSYTEESTRIHRTPVIKEKPFCNTRSIQEMNLSGQYITYSMMCASTTTEKAKEILNTELWYAVMPGGIEMPGGRQVVDKDNNKVSVTVTKFYNIPIIANLGP